MKKTARTLLLEIFDSIRPDPDRWLAVHELPIYDHSQNAIATLLPRMANEGLVVGRKRAGKQFKEWRPSEVAVKQYAPFPGDQVEA